MSILKTVATSRVARAGVVLGLVSAGLVGIATSSSAATASYKVSPVTGPTTVGTVVTITGTGFKNGAGVSQLYSTAGAVNAVQFTSAASCPAAWAAADATHIVVGALSIASATSVVVTAPALPLTSAKATAYIICVYGTANSNALLGTAKYTAYPVPTITAANSPASGSAAGGGSVVITGTGFTKASVVKFGTVTALKPVVASDGLSITVAAPAQAAAAIAVSVTTEGGVNPTPSTASWDDYTYVNALKVSPSTGLNATATTLTITGVGFSGLNFTAGANNAAVMFLPGGAYVKGVSGVGGTGAAPLCANIQVISDTQLVCDTPSTLSDTPYIVETVSDKASGAASPVTSVVSSSAAFTFAAF